MLGPLADQGLYEGAELGDGDGVVPGGVRRRVAALVCAALLPVPLQGGHAYRPPVSGIPRVGIGRVGAGPPSLKCSEPVDQPAMGVPTGGCRDVLGLKPADEVLQVGVPLGELGGGAALQVPGGRAAAAEPVDRGMRLPSGLVEGGRRPLPGLRCTPVRRGESSAGRYTGSVSPLLPVSDTLHISGTASHV